MQVYLGDHSLSKSEQKVFQVVRKVMHPQYRHLVSLAVTYDFALLELNETVPCNDLIRPACLPLSNSNAYVNWKAKVSGWGTTSRNEDVRPNVLTKTSVRIEENSACYQQYARLNERLRITEDMVCAKSATNSDSCQGDSGGKESGGNQL